VSTFTKNDWSDTPQSSAQFLSLRKNKIMWQRVQTLYHGIAIILLGIVSAGTSLFSFVGESSRYTVNAFGITTYELKSETATNHDMMPIMVGTIALALLCFICIMSFKNLPRQFKLGRMIFFLYFLGLVGIILLSSLGDGMIDEANTKRELGVGFYLFILGFPFTFLANVGIKKDKRLLDSLDRLR
jgi:glucan phosphoethanolaminetransferase (alkaline phosphatase superfamily)